MRQIRGVNVIKHHTEKEQGKDHPIGMGKLRIRHQLEPFNNQSHNQQGKQRHNRPHSYPKIIHHIHLNLPPISFLPKIRRQHDEQGKHFQTPQQHGNAQNAFAEH